jgi:DNA-binding NarL/FixJ family response regulator
MRHVGREGALAAIERALRGLDGPAQADPTAAVLQIIGEPGIGKSRLLAELAGRADQRGFLVLTGTAAEFEEDVAFAVFADAMDDYLAGPGGGGLELREPAALAHLASVFPALERRADGLVLAGAAERYRIHRAVRRLLGLLAEAAPLVLMLDDVHWADTASGELLTYLLAHPPPGRVLIAAAYRPPRLSNRVRAAFDRGHAAGQVETIELSPLTRLDAGILLGDTASAGDVEAVYAESGGNPFYLLELARAAERGSHLPGGGLRAGDVPRLVGAAIRQELSPLPAAARALARGAAVAGEPFDVQLAALAAGLSDADALGLVDVLVATGLVRPTQVPRRFTFRHPLVRRAVYESAGPGWRIEAHRRLAEVLRARGAPPAELAHHVEASAQPGDDDAIAILTAAGHAVASQAPLLAARRLGAALRLIPAGDRHAAKRLELLVPLATSLGAAGQFQDSRRALQEALARLPAEQVGTRVQLEAFCAGVEHLLGLHDHAHHRLRAVLGQLPSRRSPEAVTLLIELAGDGFWRADWPALRERATEAFTLAESLGTPAAAATAHALAAIGLYSDGEPERGVQSLDTAATIVDGLTDPELTARLDATYYLAAAEWLLGSWESGVRHADRALAVARASGQGQFFVMILINKAMSLRQLGRLREAADAAQEAVDSARLASHDQLLAFALLTDSWVALGRGDVGQAVATAADALALSSRLGPSSVAAAAGWALGDALVEAGDPVRAVTVILDTVGGPEAQLMTLGYRCHTWQVLARATADRGLYDDARAWLARLEQAAARLGTPSVPAALADYARGHILFAQGRHDEAATAALAAAATADRIHARLDAARARLLAGRALAADGQRAAATDLLDRARVELDLSGARRGHDQAVGELATLGLEAGRGVDALSPRERDIAERVAAGRTNNQIGTELFLSARTVERHLTHIFATLDISSRAQLGALLHREPATGKKPDR